MLLWFCLLSFALGAMATVFYVVALPAIREGRFNLRWLFVAVTIVAIMLGIWFWLRELLPRI